MKKRTTLCILLVALGLGCVSVSEPVPTGSGRFFISATKHHGRKLQAGDAEIVLLKRANGFCAQQGMEMVPTGKAFRMQSKGQFALTFRCKR